MKKLAIILVVLMLVGCQNTHQITVLESLVDHEVTEIEDETLLVGETEVVQESVEGQRELIYEVTTDLFSKELERRLITSKVLIEPKPKVVRIGIKQIETTSTLITDEKLEVITQEDETLDEGIEKVTQEGTLGVTKVSTQIIYIKGKVTESKEISREVVVEAQPKIIVKGTKKQAIRDFSQYSNEDLGWWFNWGNPKATINNEITALISDKNVLWQIPTENKVVYLTFDEGYEYNNNTSQILDTLRDKGVKATFFITGSYLDNNPDLVNRMVEEGHLVGNHTILHYRAAPTLESNQQTYIDDVVALNQKDSRISMFHRPPEGGYSERSLALLNSLGYKTVFWSFAYKDWLTDNQPDPKEALELILNNIHPGSILLLHPVSNTNTQILGEVIDGIRGQGYSIELLP